MPIPYSVSAAIIASLPTLTSLNLSHQKLTIEALNYYIEALQVYPSITTLDLSGNFLGDGCLKSFAKATHIKHLILMANRLTDDGIGDFIPMPSLRSLNLNLNALSDESAAILALHSQLLALSINGNAMTVKGLARLLKSQTLRSLSLMNNHLHDIDEALFSENFHLQKLFLDNNCLTDNDIRVLVHHSRLTEFSLSHNNVTETGARTLASNFQGETLNLNANHVGDNGANALAKNKYIKLLSLSHNHLSDDCADGFSQNATLTHLDLSYNHVNARTLQSLSQHKALFWLNLTKTAITVDAIKALMAHTALQQLVLSYNHLDDASAVIISQNNAILSLDLSGNFIGMEGSIALSKMGKLITLVLNNNCVGDGGAEALAASKSIQELHLSYNQVSDKGAIAFVDNINSVRQLFLTFNPISKESQLLLEQHPPLKSVVFFGDELSFLVKENLSNILSLTKDFFCVIGKNGTIQFFNSYLLTVLGYHSTELLMQSIIRFIHPEDHVLTQAIFEKSLEKSITLRFMSKTGGFCVISWRCQWHGDVIYLMGDNLSLRQKKTWFHEKLLQTSLKQAQDFKLQQATFIAHLCHEIRNPVSGVLSNIDVMSEHLLTLIKMTKKLSTSSALMKSDEDSLSTIDALADSMKKSLLDMKSCCRHQENILNDNLTLTQITEGKLSLTNSPLNLCDVINEVIAMNHAQAMRKGLKLIATLKETSEHFIKSDSMRIKQILLNVLSHAIQWTHKGSIEISLQSINDKNLDKKSVDMESLDGKIPNNHFAIVIKDTSAGLKPEALGLFFDGYVYENISMGSQYGESCLGLRIAKQLAHLMGGDMTVESEVDVGTTFTYTLQGDSLSLEEQAQFALQAKTSSPLVAVTTLRRLVSYSILMVEDNDINVKALLFILNKAGHTCLIARNGVEAVALYKEKHQQVHVILMDTYMPEMNGLEAIMAIRQFEQQQHLMRKPIITLSGNALDDDKQLAAVAGADGYLTKPAKKEILLAEIHRVIRQGSDVTLSIPNALARPVVSHDTPAWSKATTENLMKDLALDIKTTTPQRH